MATPFKSARICAIILAAGQSYRMGVPKLSATFRPGISFLEQCVSQFHAFGCDEIVVVVNADGIQWIEQEMSLLPGNVKVALNKHPERGRFFSLQQGLILTGVKQEVFVHNVDNPFISMATLNALHKASLQQKNFSWVSPRYKGHGGHPVLLSATLAEAILQQEMGLIILKDYLSDEKRTDIEVNDPNILININTLGDYIHQGLPLA